MNRPAGSVFPEFMFRTGVRTWAPNVKEAPKVAPPAAGNNRQTTLSRTAGATGPKNSTVTNLFGAKKGGKRSKTRKQRRLTRLLRRRQSRQSRQLRR